jgi:FkbM family methyltransferase
MHLKQQSEHDHDILSDLLAETADKSQTRVASILDRAIPNLSKLALFGAGTMGRNSLHRLRAKGVEPLAFIDDTLEKQGTTIDGVPVYSRAQAKVTLGIDVTVVVTILTPRFSYLEVRELLSEVGLKSCSVMMLGWAFPDVFGDILNTAVPSLITRHQSDVQRCRHIWADEYSRQSFDNQLLWRLTLDFEYLPKQRLHDLYFPTDIDLNLSDQTTFVDAGAYDGDSALQFARHMGDGFRRIVAIEPDPGNFSRLTNSLRSYIEQDRAECFNMGLGAREETLQFNATGDMSAALNAKGNLLVKVNPLDFFLPVDGPAYIKCDIEGAEWATLLASRDVIVARQPQLAISVYHDPCDLWRIPLLIRHFLPNSKLYLRAHGAAGTDVVLYAV